MPSNDWIVELIPYISTDAIIDCSHVQCIVCIIDYSTFVA